MKKTFYIWLISILLSGAFSCAAQYRFDRWTIDEGLPQNSVRAILQARDGYLWLATHDGLVRFDGLHFTVFNKSTNPNLPTTRFVSLFEADDGALWVGTESNGVLRFFAGEFENFTTKDGLPADETGGIYVESDGRIIIKTSNGTAFWENGKISVPADNLSNHERRIYYKRESKTRWTLETPNRLKRETADVVENLTLPFQIEFLNQYLTYEDREGALWVSQNSGLWRFHGGEFRKFSPEDGFSGTASCFWEDDEQTLWMGTLSNGIFQFRNGKFTHLTTADGLSSNHIEAIVQDREGTIWIGTNDRGLNRMQKQLITTISAKDGLSGVSVYPVLADSRGRVWIGTGEGKLNLFENGTLRQFEISGVRTFTENRDGSIWVCGKDNIFIIRDDKIETFNQNVPKLLVNYVLAVQTDGTGALWFSTLEGLYRFQNSEWRLFDTANGFPTNKTRFVFETRDGDFYAGTYDGLVKFENGGFRLYTTADGLPSNLLRTIYEDKEGTLWIGTYDGGLSRLKDGKFTNFRVADGLFSNGVFAIQEDERGNLWMSSNQGIHRVSKQELDDFADGKIRKFYGVGYDKRDGMVNAECNGGRFPSGAKTADGRLWFPTQDGAAIVDPKTLDFNPLPPPVVIENALVDRDKINFADEIRLAPNQNNLELQFTALSFIRSEQIRFRYKLEGLSNEWVELGTRRDAYFSYLPPGNYVFTVTAANADGVWNEQGATIRIVVVPPFYRTWWFLVLVSVVFALLILAVFRYRFSQLKREKMLAQDFSRQLIESQENERGRIAAELHDGLSQSLVIIKNRAALSLKKRADAEHAFDQLEEISQASTEAIDEAKEIIHNLRPIQLDRLGLTKAISAMLRRVGETHEINFKTDIETIDDLFSKKAESSIYRILQESVNNIVRHSNAAEAVIKIKKNFDKLEIFIKDDGEGFEINSAKNRGRGGFGLKGIRERTRLLNGESVIESETGKGTKIKIIIPIKNDEHSDS